MTLTEETLELGEELDRLDAKADDLVTAAEDSDDSASGAAVRYSASELNTRGQAVAGLVDEYGPDATVTVAGLTAGEFARVEDRVAAHRQQARTNAVPGYQRNVYVAAGLVDAPFLDSEALAEAATPAAELDHKIETVAGLSPGVTKWLYAKVDGLTTGESGNWTPIGERTATDPEA